jgi:hypothetical protein
MPQPIQMILRLCAALLLASCAVHGQAPSQPQDPSGTWYFAISGDSRDCGDLIMPKIAHAVAEDREHPAAFYWHLGDFRRMYGPDCDVVKRTHPDWDCKARPEDQLGPEEMNHYLETAWDDFIERQVCPFAPTQVFLGIGNHELAAGRTRTEFQRKFQPWLTSGPIHNQRVQEANDHFYSTEGATFFHFVKNGVDFIYLDNAGDDADFSAEQLEWLENVLNRDKADANVKTIVAGMHAALPYSKERRHAMDTTCQGLCSGQRAYDLLYRTQKLGGKHVYVFASHSHLFVGELFKTDEHDGQVIMGWLTGAAGAEQYRKDTERIQYGYALVAVHPGGTLDVRFREVRRDSPPLAAGPGAEPLTAFCFEQNKHDKGSDAFTKPCACGQAQP